MKFEYIYIAFDFGDLTNLNNLGGAGFHIILCQPNPKNVYEFWALLEREIR
jgi:hypothetical protein